MLWSCHDLDQLHPPFQNLLQTRYDNQPGTIPTAYTPKRAMHSCRLYHCTAAHMCGLQTCLGKSHDGGQNPSTPQSVAKAAVAIIERPGSLLNTLRTLISLPITRSVIPVPPAALQRLGVCSQARSLPTKNSCNSNDSLVKNSLPRRHCCKHMPRHQLFTALA